jgi:hypothetical protein
MAPRFALRLSRRKVARASRPVCASRISCVSRLELAVQLLDCCAQITQIFNVPAGHLIRYGLVCRILVMGAMTPIRLLILLLSFLFRVFTRNHLTTSKHGLGHSRYWTQSGSLLRRWCVNETLPLAPKSAGESSPFCYSSFIISSTNSASTLMHPPSCWTRHPLIRTTSDCRVAPRTSGIFPTRVPRDPTVTNWCVPIPWERRPAQRA